MINKQNNEAPPALVGDLPSDEAMWPETTFRHAYFPHDQKIAICGYDGPSTWKNECAVPANVCPICRAVLPEFWNGSEWIKLP